MELTEVLAALRAAWWLSVLGLLTGGGLALAVSLSQTPVYTAQTQLFVSTRDIGTTSDAFTGSQFSRERVTSYARLVAGEEVAARVADLLDLEVSSDALAAQITATVVPETVLIDVSVTEDSPERAADIADAVGVVFTDFVDELETPRGGGPSLVQVTVTDEPEVPASPSSPDTPRYTAVGAFVGLVVGAGLAVVRAQLDRTVHDPDQTAELAGAPVIGTVLRDSAIVKMHTIDRVGDGRTVEDYRRLRTNLRFLNVDQPPKVIMVSSALPAEGKTTLVINLALALADAGQQVAVVEADLRRPKVTRYLGLVGGVGLTNVLTGAAEVEEVVQKHRDNITVLAAGPTPPNPGELLASKHMGAVLDKLRAENDFVLVDAPPLLPVADSTGLAVHMDGVVLSVRYGSTRKDQLRQAAAALQHVGATTLGVVLNIVPPKAEQAFGYGYAYGYDTDRAPGKRGESPEASPPGS